ncbi:MAG: hypothetical protein ACFCVG_05195, partial [Kineosporiaceae bacterium]
MSQLSRTGDPLSVFGANQWLVEEQRERYERDPASVSPEWRRLFAGDGTGSNGGGTAPASAPPAPRPAAPAPPAA